MLENRETTCNNHICPTFLQAANACFLFFRLYSFGSVFTDYITSKKKDVIIDPIKCNKHVLIFCFNQFLMAGCWCCWFEISVFINVILYIKQHISTVQQDFIYLQSSGSSNIHSSRVLLLKRTGRYQTSFKSTQNRFTAMKQQHPRVRFTP